MSNLKDDSLLRIVLAKLIKPINTTSSLGELRAYSKQKSLLLLLYLDRLKDGIFLQILIYLNGWMSLDHNNELLNQL